MLSEEEFTKIAAKYCELRTQQDKRERVLADQVETAKIMYCWFVAFNEHNQGFLKS